MNYPIPKGWRRIYRGRRRKGDKSWFSYAHGGGEFKDVVEDAGLPVNIFYCIIRRAKKTAAHTPRLRYYEKCVKILSKAQPWEQRKVVKALCILVGAPVPAHEQRKDGTHEPS
jgi:hypothetical protein